MIKHMTLKAMLLAIGVGFLPWAVGQESQETCQPDEVGVATGGPLGTYFKFGKDMQSIAQASGLKLCIRETAGSVENIRLINDRDANAALAIVQSDVLVFLKRRPDQESKKIADRLRLVFPFYNEEIHLFARKEIQKIEDLQGKRVVVGKSGSGNRLTATNLLDIVNVTPSEYIDWPPEDAVLAVLRGQVDAMFYVAGKPVEVFDRLNDLSKPEHKAMLEKVHFVPLTDNKIFSEYEASKISGNDYKWLGDATIPTAAVKAVLVSYDFSSPKNSYYKKRCQQLSQFGQVIRSNLAKLQQEGSSYHKKWKEVDLDSAVINWAPDTCSRPQQPPVSPGKRLGPDDGLEDCLKRKNC